MADELAGFSEAAAQAIAEMEAATSVDEPPSLPEGEGSEAEPADGQAEETIDEQPTTEVPEVPEGEPEGEAEEESLFGEVELDQTGEPSITEADLEEFTFEIKGESVPLAELKDGYLRQSDYTKKTQELAALRKAADKAVAFWEAIEADPKGVVAHLAVQAGLIEEGAAPVRQVEISPIQPPEEVEAEIERRVEEALAAHPVVREAEEAAAVRWVESEFGRIEESYSVKLSKTDRQAILKTAKARGVTDLELVFQSLLALKQRQTESRQTLAASAPARPTGHGSQEAVTTPAASFEEAAERALAQMNR